MSRPNTLPVLLAALSLAACQQAASPDVAAEVNSRPITFEDLEKRYKMNFSSTTPETSDDQVAIQKLEILRSMIDSEIMLQRAEKQGLMAVDADVEARFNELKTPYTTEEFQKQLDSRNMSAADLREQIRRDLSVQKLFNKEITSKISISDADVTAFYNGSKDSFNLAEPQVHLATILVTPQPDPSTRSLSSDNASTEEEALRKIQMIETRLRQGDDFNMLAQNFSEDPETGPNGGDMGFVPMSALEQAATELRRLISTLQPGQFSPVVKTAEGYRILKVVSVEPAGQRELDDPRVQQTIRETLLNRKDQLLKAAYYEMARNEAQVVNHYAVGVFDGSDKGAGNSGKTAK
jgi:peptidyl-prolyl cis-trans isomerase SurA